MKRIIACMTAAALLLGMTACHRQTPDEPGGATLEVALSHSYKSEKLELEGYSYYSAFLCGDRALLCSKGDVDTYIYTLYDPTTGSSAQTELEMDSEPIIGAAAVGDTIEMFYMEWADEEKNYRSYLLTYDLDMNRLSKEEVSELWRGAEAMNDYTGKTMLFAWSWTRDDAGNQYIGGDNGVWCLTADGALHEIDGISTSDLVFAGREGRVYSAYEKISVIDPETMTGQSTGLSNLPQRHHNEGNYMPGNRDYDFAYTDGISLYGVKLEEGVTEELVNWEDSDYTGYEGGSALLLPDGHVLVSSEGESFVLTARTQEEADALQLISMVSGGSMDSFDYLVNMAHKFNRQADGYRITIRSYLDGFGEYEKAEAAYEADLLAGVIPDICVGMPNYEALSNKGMFEDWRPWMENDPDFHKDEYLYNLFESMTYKDRMEQIAFHFTVQTYLAKTEYLGGRERLTIESIPDLQLPEGMSLLNGSRTGYASRDFGVFSFTQLGSFVDFSAGTCSFDSPEFVQLLELFGSLPEDAPIEDEDAWREDRALLYYANLDGLIGLHNEIVDNFGHTDVTLTGLPFGGSEGNGGIFQPYDTITVSSQSLYKEEIWEFIKFCLREENQDPTNSYYMPVNLSALEKSFAADQQPIEGGTHYYVNGVEIIRERTPATQEESERFMVFLKGITASAFANSQITEIVWEEAGKYFSGDCTAGEAAGSIQGRVSIYLAEQS